jgi:hypothetical protein
MKVCETCGVELSKDGKCPACRSREIGEELAAVKKRLQDLEEELAAVRENAAAERRRATKQD